MGSQQGSGPVDAPESLLDDDVVVVVAVASVAEAPIEKEG